MKERILELLYRSFEQVLSKEEANELRDALADSPKLQEEKKQLVELRKMIHENSERSFKPFFSSRVMRQIDTLENQGDEFFESLMSYFKLAAVTASLMLIILLTHNALSEKDFSVNSLLAVPEYTLEEIWNLDDPAQEDFQ